MMRCTSLRVVARGLWLSLLVALIATCVPPNPGGPQGVRRAGESVASRGAAKYQTAFRYPITSLPESDVSRLATNMGRFADATYRTTAELPYSGSGSTWTFDGLAPRCNVGIVAAPPVPLSVPLNLSDQTIVLFYQKASNLRRKTHEEAADLIQYNAFSPVFPTIVIYPELRWSDSVDTFILDPGATTQGPFYTDSISEGMIWISYNWLTGSTHNKLHEVNVLQHELMHLIARVIHNTPNAVPGPGEISEGVHELFLNTLRAPGQSNLFIWKGDNSNDVI